jgi:hypothetical protein
MVTHLTTNPPVGCLNRAERTGSLVFNVLWSYVKDCENLLIILNFSLSICISTPLCLTIITSPTQEFNISPL